MMDGLAFSVAFHVTFGVFYKEAWLMWDPSVPLQGMVNQSQRQNITVLISGPAEDGETLHT